MVATGHAGGAQGNDAAREHHDHDAVLRNWDSRGYGRDDLGSSQGGGGIANDFANTGKNGHASEAQEKTASHSK